MGSHWSRVHLISVNQICVNWMSGNWIAENRLGVDHFCLFALEGSDSSSLRLSGSVADGVVVARAAFVGLIAWTL